MSDIVQHAARTHPLVSCIMPTANRRNFIARAIKYFLRQDYDPKELVIVDDGTDCINDIVPDDSRIRYFRNDKRLPLGAKRNFACEQARGEIIVHWDDDDWSAAWRLKYQVENLLKNHADACGLDSLIFYSPSSDEAWKYIYPKGNTPWLAGGTLCYTRSLWIRHPFPAIDIGEDARFVWGSRPNKLLALADSGFYVAFVHTGNTSPKHTQNRMWHPLPGSEARKMMGRDWPPPERTAVVGVQDSEHNDARPHYAVHTGNTKPLVTCLMATRDRQAFVRQSIKYFLDQDYVSKELLILDDGYEPVAGLIPKTDKIRYLRLNRPTALGEKRNIGVGAGRGDIIVLWDDDDWHSPHRVSYQVDPIIAGRADATVLQDAFLFDLPHGRFLSCESGLRDRMFAYGVIGGTVAFRKKLFDETIRFPKANLAEDAAFLRRLFESRAKVEKLPCGDSFVYIRHGRNTWSFNSGNSQLAGGWRLESPPSFVPAEDLEFYESLRKKLIERSGTGMIRKKENGSRSRAVKGTLPDIRLSVQGARLYRQGKYEEALECLERAAHAESNPWITFDTGLCLLALHRPLEALDKIQSAQSQITANTWVFSALGKVLARLGRYSDARKAFDSARRIAADNSEAAIFMDGSAEKRVAEGLRLRALGRIQEALAYFDAAIMKERRCLRALEQKADVLSALGKVSEAFPYIIASAGIRAGDGKTTKVAASALIDAGYPELAEMFSLVNVTVEKDLSRVSVQSNAAYADVRASRPDAGAT